MPSTRSSRGRSNCPCHPPSNSVNNWPSIRAATLTQAKRAGPPMPRELRTPAECLARIDHFRRALADVVDAFADIDPEECHAFAAALAARGYAIHLSRCFSYTSCVSSLERVLRRLYSPHSRRRARRSRKVGARALVLDIMQLFPCDRTRNRDLRSLRRGGNCPSS